MTKRRFFFLIIVLSYFIFPKNDVISEHPTYHLTIDETNCIIYHHKTGTELTYELSHDMLTIYFPSYNENENSHHFNRVVRSISGKVDTYFDDHNGFPTPSEYNLWDFYEVLLKKDPVSNPLNIPNFNTMMTKPFFPFFLAGLICVTCPWLLITVVAFNGRSGEMDFSYDEDTNGKAVRFIGVALLGFSAFIFLIHLFI